MSKVFEYYAVKNVVSSGDFRIALNDYYSNKNSKEAFEDLADFALSRGMIAREAEYIQGALILFPDGSRRERPACALVSLGNIVENCPWNSYLFHGWWNAAFLEAGKCDVWWGKMKK